MIFAIFGKPIRIPWNGGDGLCAKHESVAEEPRGEACAVAAQRTHRVHAAKGERAEFLPGVAIRIRLAQFIPCLRSIGMRERLPQHREEIAAHLRVGVNHGDGGCALFERDLDAVAQGVAFSGRACKGLHTRSGLCGACGGVVCAIVRNHGYIYRIWIRLGRREHALHGAGDERFLIVCRNQHRQRTRQ